MLPQNLYVFGLQVENEAKQVAQLAREKGRRALVIASETALSRRLAQAFADEFARRGGTVVGSVPVHERLAAALIKLRDSIAAGVSDVIFLALDAQRARLIRSYLGGAQAIFATSLVYVSADPLANFELNGVYFVDMPWLLSPDHPAVMAYARSAQSSLEFQRFYALGIDAYRIAQESAQGQREPCDLWTASPAPSLPAREHRFVRESIPAQFNQGETRTLSDTLGRPQRMIRCMRSPATQAEEQALGFLRSHGLKLKDAQLHLPSRRDRPHPDGRQDAGIRRSAHAAQPRLRRRSGKHHAAQADAPDRGRTSLSGREAGDAGMPLRCRADRVRRRTGLDQGRVWRVKHSEKPAAFVQ